MRKIIGYLLKPNVKLDDDDDDIYMSQKTKKLWLKKMFWIYGMYYNS